MRGARGGKLKETPANTPRLSSLPSFSLPLPLRPKLSRVPLARKEKDCFAGYRFGKSVLSSFVCSQVIIQKVRT